MVTIPSIVVASTALLPIRYIGIELMSHRRVSSVAIWTVVLVLILGLAWYVNTLDGESYGVIAITIPAIVVSIYALFKFFDEILSYRVKLDLDKYPGETSSAPAVQYYKAKRKYNAAKKAGDITGMETADQQMYYIMSNDLPTAEYAFLNILSDSNKKLEDIFESNESEWALKPDNIDRTLVNELRAFHTKINTALVKRHKAIAKVYHSDMNIQNRASMPPVSSDANLFVVSGKSVKF